METLRARVESLGKRILSRFLRWVELWPHRFHRGFLNYDPGLADAFVAFESLDYSQAYQLFLLAAEQGNPSAQSNVGILLEAGLGVPQSDEAAESWYRKAAEQGYPAAQLQLASILVADLVARDQASQYREQRLILNPQTWISVEASRERVAQLERTRPSAAQYATATEQSHIDVDDPIGAFRYGLDPLSGEQIADPSERRRYVEAYKWAWLAKRQGHAPARVPLRLFTRFMSHDEVAEGKRLAKSWWEFKGKALGARSY
jgi:TPR repeat protein